jgi:D-alanyl-D-alanine carboxypeptidase
MKVFTTKRFKHLCLPFIAQLIICSAISAQGFSPSVQTRLQHIIDSFQNNPANPIVGGMSVAIKVDELAMWQGVTGYAARNVDAQNNLLPGGTAFTKNMLSRMYSVTKTFTSPLVLELAKEGYFNLDALVSNFIPLQAINPGLNGSVTIRQLLAHESGYSDYTDELMLQIAVAFQPTHVWTAYETISFCHQINVPGAERRYSSTNYIMLGAIIEAVTGKPMEQHYRERFFNPLHLTSMYLGGRESQNGHGELAAPHDNISAFNPIFQLTGQPTFPDAYTNISRFTLTGVVSLAFSGGGIVTNAADLAEWGNALFGGRATSASTLQTMMNSISATPDDDNDYLGYGIWTNKKISATDYFVGHIGSALGYRSVMMYQTDRKMTIAIVTNYRGCNPYEIARVLYEALPNFLCGNSNRKEDKILLCYKGKDLCIARAAASVHLKKGAYLGSCEQQNTTTQINPKINVNEQPLIKEGDASFYVFPNPFSNNIIINYKASQTGMVNIQLYDINGKLIKQIFTGNLQNGMTKQITLQSLDLAAGTYICRVQTTEGINQRKLILTR